METMDKETYLRGAEAQLQQMQGRLAEFTTEIGAAVEGIENAHARVLSDLGRVEQQIAQLRENDNDDWQVLGRELDNAWDDLAAAIRAAVGLFD